MPKRLTPEVARTWRTYVPRVVRPPRLALIGWLVTIVVSFLLEADAPCTPASPCLGNPADAAAFTVLGTVVVGAFAAPRTGALAAVALGVMGFWFDLDGRPVEARLLVYTLFVASAVWSVVATVFSRRNEREWREFVDRYTTPVALPADVARRPARAARMAAAFAVAALLAAIGLAQWSFAKVAAERRREAAAPVADALVVAHEDGDVLLRTGDVTTTYTVYDTGDYPVDSFVPVYVVGGRLRPVAEPYDASGVAFFPCIAVALSALAAEEAWRCRRAAARFAQPVPAWSVGRWVTESGVPVTARDPEHAILRVRARNVPLEYGGEFDAELWRYGGALRARVPLVVAGELIPGGWVAVLADGVPVGVARAALAGRKRIARRERQ